MAETDGSESERDGLNAVGNPRTEVRSEEGGRTGEGNLGQVFPTGILARGTEDKSLRGGRGGVAKGSEKLRTSRR